MPQEKMERMNDSFTHAHRMNGFMTCFDGFVDDGKRTFKVGAIAMHLRMGGSANKLLFIGRM